MSTILIEDAVKEALERNAAACGMTLSAYLDHLIRANVSVEGSAGPDPVILAGFAEILDQPSSDAPVLGASKSQSATSKAFEDQMTSKFRKMGFTI